jgi:hypothetical protein
MVAIPHYSGWGFLFLPSVLHLVITNMYGTYILLIGQFWNSNSYLPFVLLTSMAVGIPVFVYTCCGCWMPLPLLACVLQRLPEYLLVLLWQSLPARVERICSNFEAWQYTLIIPYTFTESDTLEWCRMTLNATKIVMTSRWMGSTSGCVAFGSMVTNEACKYGVRVW